MHDHGERCYDVMSLSLDTTIQYYDEKEGPCHVVSSSIVIEEKRKK